MSVWACCGGSRGGRLSLEEDERYVLLLLSLLQEGGSKVLEVEAEKETVWRG